MKKILSIFLVVVLLFCLASCGVSDFYTAQPQEQMTDIRTLDDSDIRIWTDTETGVQYVILRQKVGYAGMGGICPRLNSDGSLYIVER